MFRFLLALPLLGGLVSCASMDDDKVHITVHAQGSEMDSPKTVFRRPIEGRQVVFKIIPEFSSQSIAAVHTFPADDGTHGVALKLDFKGTQALDMVTRMRRGEILMTMVNGTVVDYVAIDQPVSDGVFTVWRGLPQEFVTILDEKYPHINELKSSSEFLDMTPSTPKEKKEAQRRAEREAKEKAEEEARKARGEAEPETPEGEAVPLKELLKTSR